MKPAWILRSPKHNPLEHRDDLAAELSARLADEQAAGRPGALFCGHQARLHALLASAGGRTCERRGPNLWVEGGLM